MKPRKSLLIAMLIITGAWAASADTIVLRDGTRLHGRIVEESAETVVIERIAKTQRGYEELGRMVIQREDIHQVSYAPLEDTRFEGWMRRDPDFNSVLLCPTPATLPKGDNYFRSFEVYIVNFGWAPTSSTNLSFMTHFPIASFMDFGSVGLKQRLIDREEHVLGMALAASYTFFPAIESNLDFLTGSLILGVGDRERSLNVVVNQSYSKDEDPFTYFMIGADMRIGSRAKFLVEYMSSSDFVDDDFDGLVNLGFRLYGDRWSFSFTGIRPLEATDNFIMFPMVQFSFHF